MCRTARSFRTSSVSYGFFPLKASVADVIVLSFHMLRSSLVLPRQSVQLKTISRSREGVTDAYATRYICRRCAIVVLLARTHTRTQDYNCPRLSVYACLFVFDAAFGTLRNARCRVQPFLFVKHRQVGMITSFIEAYTRWISPRHYYAFCQTDYVSTS